MNKFHMILPLCLLLILSGCTTLPGGNSSEQQESREESKSSEISMPQESSVAETSSVPENSSVSEESSSEGILQDDSFTWMLEPTIEADAMLPIRDGDQPGQFVFSPSVCFVREGLMGLMNQAGNILLPAEYTDICNSRSAGGLLVLKEGSSSYQRLNNQYEPAFDVEYAFRSATATTPYIWDEAAGSILDTSNESQVYSEPINVVVRQDTDTELYAIGNSEGLLTDFIYTGFGPTGLTNQFFVKDSAGWHLVNQKGEDLLGGILLNPRLAREFSLSRSISSSVHYVETAPYPCSEGTFALESEGKWGYYDASGNQLTPLLFDDACPVAMGKAWVQVNGKWGLISIEMSSIAVG